MGYPASRLFIDTNRNSVPIDFSGNEINEKKQYAVAKIENNGDTAIIFFYDTTGNPVYISDGSYGKIYLFDNNRRIVKSASLDKDGSMLSDYYSKIEYYIDGSVKLQLYFNTSGEPVKLERGQYGVLYEGETARYVYKDCNILFRLDTLLRNYPIVVAIVATLMCFFSVFTMQISCIRFISIIPAVILIIYETLTGRASANPRAILEPFWSYSQFLSSTSMRLEIMNNICLFIPLGASLRSVSSNRKIIFVAMLFSAFIEVLQYVTGMGLMELDDVISNTIGGILGFYMASCLLTGWNNQRKKIRLKEGTER